LGQEFSGYAAQARKAAARARRGIVTLAELAIGGTAVGTGINCHAEFAARVCRILETETGLVFREAANHFEAQGGRDDCVEVAGALAAIATATTKIANDIRLLGSGPRAGLAELRVPPTQPGSSIMPGKVNPVMSEMLVQVGMYVHGLTQTTMLCGRDGHLELNVTLPLMAHCLHESIACLAKGVNVFTDRCIAGLAADAAHCRELVDRSLMLVTALNPFIGYDQAAAVAKEAFATHRTLREVVLAKRLMDPAALDRALDPTAMTKPNSGRPGAGSG
jgi:fumarate hydratase class II